MKNLKLNKDNVVLVSDFDGTISKVDFFAYVTENLLTPSDMQPWYDYKSGEITHVEALNRIFKKIRLDIDDFHSFIDKIEVEEYFAKTVDYCIQNSIKVYVVSAGADYYIDRILKKIKVDKKIELIANPSNYSQNNGLELFPFEIGHKYYDQNLGVSKQKFIQNLQMQGLKVIFAGDGIPDVEAASVSDVVFAKDYLLDICLKKQIQYQNFSTYKDIYEFILNI